MVEFFDGHFSYIFKNKVNLLNSNIEEFDIYIFEFENDF
jgi:hypothetical protein